MLCWCNGLMVLLFRLGSKLVVFWGLICWFFVYEVLVIVFG